MLKTADFKPFYVTGEDNEPSAFLYEGLTNSCQFDLGLGYFRSTGFSCLALGFASFIQKGGSMRFIINDSLTEKDKTAILRGLQELSDTEYEQTLLENLETLTQTLTKRSRHFFDCLSWLISSNKLQMIAVVPKKNKIGIVHHKFGVFTDENGDQAAFNGSVNFSQYALQYNVESIWCEYSWDAHGIATVRIDEMIRLFENTWRGISPAVRTIPLEQVKIAIKNKFPKKTFQELVDTECELAREVIEFPGTSDEYKKKLEKMILQLRSKNAPSDEPAILPSKWRHQQDAIDIFRKNERGVLNMATGTGKTRTALQICKTLIKPGDIDTIIITCDGTDLLDQWYKQLLNLVAQEKISWVILRQYESNHQSDRFRINSLKKIMLISRQQLHLVLGRINDTAGAKTLLIHDEVHKLGSAGNREKLAGLSDNIRYRLGLSATPEREYDEEGTAFVFSHIGPVIFSFSLEDAIRKGILSPFNYFPIDYTLTAEDKARLRNVHAKKAARESTATPMTDEEFWTELARVYKTAEGKIPAFRNFINSHREMLERCVVFVETKDFGEQMLNIIHEIHPNFHTYYGGEDASVLSRFAKGDIECLLTCHRLSEGIDIQSLKNVILLSSAKARLETIQRIGRCLRIDPKNPDKIANVVDLIRIDDDDQGKSNSDQERRLFLLDLSHIKPENL